MGTRLGTALVATVVALVTIVVALVALAAVTPTALAGSTPPSGGTGLPSPTAPSQPTAPAPPTKVPPPPGRHARGHWLPGVEVTQYWPVPESWFSGRLVATPGLPGLHRIDWLYSATGVSMEGEGIDLDGGLDHIDALGAGGWVNAAGQVTNATTSGSWSRGAPYWRDGGFWRNRHGAVTFPLQAGGWSNGPGRRYIPLRGVSFAAGGSRQLHYDQSIAVDPRVIALGSRVYVPAYRDDGHGGWFIAQDTGGAIIGRHIDVYRAPPTTALDTGATLQAQRIYVIPARG